MPKDDRKIRSGGIRVSHPAQNPVNMPTHSVFSEGDEDELAAAVDQATLDRLVDAGELEGDWTSTLGKPARKKAEAAKEEGGGDGDGGGNDREASEGDEVPLPEGFPHLKLLAKAGIKSYEKLTNTADDDLLGISGIGAAALDKIRDAVSNA